MPRGSRADSVGAVGVAVSKILGAALALVLLAPPASAQPAASSVPPPEPAASSADVLAHFKNGSRLYDGGDYAGALEEYRAALRGHRTAATMHAVAACLEQLARYDEALDQYDELRREFPKLSNSLEAKVAPAIEKLQGKVGTVVVAGDVPDQAAKATLFVDDRKLPFTRTLRLAVGTHSVRAEKDGFSPIRATVNVKARQESIAELRAEPKQARLRVSEKHGWVLRVEIDGEVVGQTPWEEMVAPGAHRVRLFGSLGLDALANCAAPDASPGAKVAAAREEVTMASSTKTESVSLFEAKDVTLGAEAQDSFLNIVSTPSGASVSIDSRSMGKTPWEGPVAVGEHAVEVDAEGFLPAKTRVSIERWKHMALPVVLEPDPAVQRRLARTLGAGAGYGVGALGLVVFAVTGALALDKANQLKSSCYGSTHCPGTQQANVSLAQTLGNVSTASLVVGGLGAVSGTVVLLALRPPTTSGGSGAGVGQLELAGRF